MGGRGLQGYEAYYTTLCDTFQTALRTVFIFPDWKIPGTGLL
jgi:hypothetical protein